MILYPSTRLVCFINKRQIERHGGSDTSPNNLRVEGAIDLFLEIIQVRVFGTDPFPTLYEKVAALTWKIITEHPFYDGNKRTGMATALTFLKMNDRQIHVTEDELVEVALQIATSTKPALAKMI